MLQKTLLASVLAASSLAQASVLPETPVPFKYGTGVVDQQTIYIGLGSAGKAWYKFDNNSADKQWQTIAEFPGAPREQATALLLNGDIYVFGGVGKNASGDTQIMQDIYQYSPKSNSWRQLRSHSPYGLVGQAGVSHNGKAIIMGGVNQNIFNGYFADMAAAGDNKQQQNKIISDYFNKPIADYFYNRAILAFDPISLQWSSFGEFPYAGTAGSALISDGKTLTLVNGELKPGLRTDNAWQGHFHNDSIHWQKIDSVASPDGVAGAFSGVSHGHILFAGGAAFAGSMAKYKNSHYYAHEGLSKSYHNRVYHLTGTQWKKAGELPAGIAYGVSLPWRDGLLLIGGETSGGKAITSSIWLTIQDNKLHIEK